MRMTVLAATAALVFTMPSAWAQSKTNTSGDAYRKAACDCKKPNMKFGPCMQRRLGYTASEATAANIYCAAPAAKGKKG